jgi:hypothetical protein
MKGELSQEEQQELYDGNNFVLTWSILPKLEQAKLPLHSTKTWLFCSIKRTCTNGKIKVSIATYYYIK